MKRILYAISFVMLTTTALPVAAYAACVNSAGVAGDILYNVDHTVLQYCDNTDWIGMGGGGGGDEGVSGPNRRKYALTEKLVPSRPPLANCVRQRNQFIQ